MKRQVPFSVLLSSENLRSFDASSPEDPYDCRSSSTDSSENGVPLSPPTTPQADTVGLKFQRASSPSTTLSSSSLSFDYDYHLDYDYEFELDAFTDDGALMLSLKTALDEAREYAPMISTGSPFSFMTPTELVSPSSQNDSNTRQSSRGQASLSILASSKSHASSPEDPYDRRTCSSDSSENGVPISPPPTPQADIVNLESQRATSPSTTTTSSSSSSFDFELNPLTDDGALTFTLKSAIDEAGNYAPETFTSSPSSYCQQ